MSQFIAVYVMVSPRYRDQVQTLSKEFFNRIMSSTPRDVSIVICDSQTERFTVPE